MRPTTPMILAGASLLAAGCAADRDDVASTATEAAETRECFWPAEVSGFSDAGDDQVLIHTGPGETYLFETFGPCPNLDFSFDLGVRARTPGMICRGIDVDLLVPSPGLDRPERCPVRMIRKLSEAEAEAY